MNTEYKNRFEQRKTQKDYIKNNIKQSGLKDKDMNVIGIFAALSVIVLTIGVHGSPPGVQ